MSRTTKKPRATARRVPRRVQARYDSRPDLQRAVRAHCRAELEALTGRSWDEEALELVRAEWRDEETAYDARANAILAQLWAFVTHGLRLAVARQRGCCTPWLRVWACNGTTRAR
jgi:hypothetical protein